MSMISTLRQRSLWLHGKSYGLPLSSCCYGSDRHACRRRIPVCSDAQIAFGPGNAGFGANG
jgi:hypothetical protein